MTEIDTPLLSTIKSLQTSPPNMRKILEELSRMLHADASWSRADIFRAGEILLDGKGYQVIDNVRYFLDFLLDLD
jgi:hypothetical protein